MSGTGDFESDLVLNHRLLKVVEGGMTEALEVASAISEYGKDDTDLTSRTQDMMLSFVHMENEIKRQISVLEHVKTMASKKGEVANLLSIYQEKLQELETSKSSDPHSLRQHPKFKELQTTMESSVTGDIEEQLAVLRQRLTGGTGDDSQSGELAFTEVEVNTRCPYTGMTMQEPVRNTRCGHVYDKEGILTYIRQKKDKAKCPVGGCGNTNAIQVSNLEDDRDMKRYIHLMSQSQR